uniref:VIT domain-containing protein n=1 Tax=Poecilia reticulata TaxID=8081 RepID=A0A3P9PKM3_POERE
MPGLINKESQCALPLSVSDITCCVRGYTLALTASMTYENIEDHAIEGIFIYPLEENSIVVGFEAMISSQIITLQIKGKAKLDDCYQDICRTANGGLQSNTGKAEDAVSDWSNCRCFRATCLLCVGVESPSHAIRADADPLARSATSVVITLADKYTYDCPVEILIYPSGEFIT